MKTLLLSLAALAAVSGPASAATLSVTPGSGATLGQGVDGSGNLLGATVICGAAATVTLYATCVNQVVVTASGQLSFVQTAGSVASGAYSSGSFVAGALADGAIATIGTEADTAWASGNGTVVAILKKIAGNSSETGFTPSLSYSTPLSVTTTSTPGGTALPAGATTGSVVKVYNQGAAPLFWTVGNSSVVATTAMSELAPYSWDSFVVPSGATNIAAITKNSGQTATLNAELGTGVPSGTGGPINLAVAQGGITSVFYDVIGGLDNGNLARALQATAPGTSASNFALGVQGVTSGVPMPVSQATAANLNVTAVGGSGAALATNSALIAPQSAPGTPQSTALTIQGNASGVPVPISGSITASFSQFAPNGNYSTPLTVGATSARTTLPAGGGSTVAVYNTGANAAFVQLGSSSVVATASDDQVAPGGFLCFAVGSNADIAAIETAGATTLNISGGSGGCAGSGGGGGSGSAAADTNLTTTGTISAANVFGTGLSNVGNGVLTGTATANSQITSTGAAGFNTVYVECSGLGSAGNSWFEFDKTAGGGGANQWKRMAAFTGPNFSGAFNVAGATGVGMVADKFGSASPNCQFRGSVNLATLDASSGPVVGNQSASLAMSTITTTQAIAEVPGLSIFVTGWTEVTSGAATADGNWQFVSSGSDCAAGTTNVRTPKNFSANNGISMSGSVGGQFTLQPGCALSVSNLAAQSVDFEFTYTYQ